MLKYRFAKSNRKTANGSPAEKNQTVSLREDLRTLTTEDFSPSEKKEKKKRSRLSNLLTVLILCLCAAVFLYSVVEIAINLISQKRAQVLYANMAVDFFEGEEENEKSAGILLREDFTGQPTPDISVRRKSSRNQPGKTVNRELERFRAKLTALAGDNPDTYGWITVEGTNINYPIVQAEDNDYYLNRSFQDKYLPFGSIYADFVCSRVIEENFNTVLYGHNVTSNGTMFNGVTDFLSKSFFDKYGKITVYTIDGIYTYEVFSVYETDYVYHYRKTDFADDIEFEPYLEELQGNSLWEKKDYEPKGSDRILTLSTCTSSLFSTRRYALHAYLVSVEK